MIYDEINKIFENNGLWYAGHELAVALYGGDMDLCRKAYGGQHRWLLREPVLIHRMEAS